MIEVIKSGLFSSIQDLGRSGYRKYGVPVSGAMDQFSSRLANQLVGNDEDAAVLEVTMLGPTLRFTVDCNVAICGARFSLSLDNTSVPMDQCIYIQAGQTLHFGSCPIGVRAYLAVQGGLSIEPVLGSRSQYSGITEDERLQKGDQIFMHNSPYSVLQGEFITEFDFSSKMIEVETGPEWGQLSDLSRQCILSNVLQVLPTSNRMAYRLVLCEEEVSLPDIITSPILPGTVQLTPSGDIIVMMRDAPVTGGYSRILQLTENGINGLAQKRAGEDIQFNLLA